MGANSELSDFQSAVRTALREHWKWFLFQGIVILILGCLAVAEPVIASVAVDIYVGWLFMFSGLLGPRSYVLGARRIGILLDAAHRRALACRRHHVGLEACRGGGFTHARLDGILFRRRRLPSRSITLLSRCHAQFVGLAARERNRGSRSCGAHHLFLAAECELDARPYRGRQFDHDRSSNPHDRD
jgi:hypothetical protein